MIKKLFSIFVLLSLSPVTAMVTDDDEVENTKNPSTPITIRRQEIQEEIADAKSGLEEAKRLVRTYENDRAQCLSLPECEERRRGIEVSEGMMRTFNMEAGELGNKLISLRRELKKLDDNR